MNGAEVLYVRTKAGRIHNAAVVNDRVLTDEACNLDDAAGELEVLTAMPADVDETALCERCFKRPEEQA